MVSEYFPCVTFHQLSAADQRDYSLYGSVRALGMEEGANLGMTHKWCPEKVTRAELRIRREEDIYQKKAQRNMIAPRRSYNFKTLLKCVEVLEEVLTDEGHMLTMLTEFAGVVDVETLSTRYILHFDSPHRKYILTMLTDYHIPHTRCKDGHTTEVLRMDRQPKPEPWWRQDL